MRIQIELTDNLEEDEVLIRCSYLNEDIRRIEEAVKEISNHQKGISCYRGDVEYFISLEDMLFFETEDGMVWAHTRDCAYETRYKLYELEEILPGHFMRISKSAILNVATVYSISRNLSAASEVAFKGTHKTVYVSRHYFKPLKCKLEEMRIRR